MRDEIVEDEKAKLCFNKQCAHLVHLSVSVSVTVRKAGEIRVHTVCTFTPVHLYMCTCVHVYMCTCVYNTNLSLIHI